MFNHIFYLRIEIRIGEIDAKKLSILAIIKIMFMLPFAVSADPIPILGYHIGMTSDKLRACAKSEGFVCETGMCANFKKNQKDEI